VPDWNGWWLGSSSDGNDLDVKGGVVANAVVQYHGGAPRDHVIRNVFQPPIDRFSSPYWQRVGGTMRASQIATAGPRLRLANGEPQWTQEPGFDIVASDLTFGGLPDDECGSSSGQTPLLATNGVVYLSGSVRGAGQIAAPTVWINARGALDPCPAHDGDLALSIKTDLLIIGARTGATWSSAEASSGDTKLEVADNSSIPVGSTVVLGLGTEEEEDALVIAHGSLVFAQPLRFDHPVGTLVVDVHDPPDDIPGIAALIDDRQSGPGSSDSDGGGDPDTGVDPVDPGEVPDGEGEHGELPGGDTGGSEAEVPSDNGGSTGAGDRGAIAAPVAEASPMPSRGRLPFTGATPLPVIVLAAALMAAGRVLIALSRRPRRRA
jgi:hypothetical protein